MSRKPQSWRALIFAVGICLVSGIFMFVISQQAAAGVLPNPSADGIWQNVDEATLSAAHTRTIIPNAYRTVALDEPALQAILAQAPMEFTVVARDESVVLSLPLPNGKYGRFRIIESPIMAPELGEKFPWMRTYAGRGLDDVTATVRFDWTQFGFHAMIVSSQGTVYIDPYSRDDTIHYIVYNKNEINPANGFVEQEPFGDNSEVEAILAEMRANGGSLPSGDELRTYRLALATTGEYTQFHGGTVPDGMAAVVTAMNRVNGIYEREVAVRMELIANNDLIIYTDGATDPYTNNSGGTMLGENQTNLDSVIGDANYDVGHVFSTGGGGVAFLGVPCRTGMKARGVTGLPAPIGDPFYVDYVAHEMGHQYGGNHTFNGNAGSCAGGNRNGSTAYEPGSATTIMGYAGICGNQNIQSNSDDYFHGVNFDEMRAYTVVGSGNGCPVITATGNAAPTVDAGQDYVIPLQTPFMLNGSGTDPNSDTLTFGWEEFDLGPAGHPNNPVANAPIFRSFTPVSDTFRIFPQISDIVNNTQTIGELLPTYARTMNFRLTARDNHMSPSAGGVNYDMMTVTVSDQAGPFLVTNPNTAVTWLAGTIETVTWDVASTDQAPVNCANVDILLSSDGGYTYPVVIEAATPNDGTEDITVPIVPTSTARVQVACADNIFFDISDTNFTIDASEVAILTVAKSVSAPDPLTPGTTLTYTINVGNMGNLTATTTIADSFPDGITNPVCNGVPGDLDVQTSIEPAAQADYECTAEVDSSLLVDMTKTVDQAVVAADTAVTYTITVTNPNSVTLTNVVVADPDVAGCSPALGTPITLAPAASQTYVCANNVITETTTNTASVTAEAVLTNIATASAPEAPGSPVSSEPVVVTVTLAEADSVTVTVESGYIIYLPLLLKEE